MSDYSCVAGCKIFHGGEIKHHKDCPYYPDSLSQRYDEMKTELKKYKKEKRSPLPDGTLPLTKEERRHISEKYLGYLFSEITIKRHTMHGDIGLFLLCDREIRIDDLRIILWIAERFNLEV